MSHEMGVMKAQSAPIGQHITPTMLAASSRDMHVASGEQQKEEGNAAPHCWKFGSPPQDISRGARLMDVVVVEFIERCM